MEKINEALGVSKDASEELALNAINKLKEDSVKQLNSVDLTKFVPRKDYEVVLNSKTSLENKLKTQEQEALQKAGETLIESALKEGRIDADSKEILLPMCNSKEGLETVTNYLKKRPSLNSNILADKENKTPNAHSITKEDEKMMHAFGLTKEEILAAKQNGSFEVVTEKDAEED